MHTGEKSPRVLFSAKFLVVVVLFLTRGSGRNRSIRETKVSTEWGGGISDGVEANLQ